MHDQVLMASETDSIFYSTFSSNSSECMNNEESTAAVYWTSYLWALCIGKCNPWMTEKPIKVVIKLQMSPFCFPVFQHGRPNMLLSLAVCVPLANTYIAIWYGTHFPIQFLPAASVKTLGEIHLFQLHRQREHISLSLGGEGELLRTGLIPRYRATLKRIGELENLPD